MHKTIEYRYEIDGLRALALIPVILFHAGFDTFNGGYIGVDIFFVISGYLITSIIIRQIEEREFSIINFYQRRARRILPALFFVVLCCLPLAWICLTPKDMKDFAQSLVGVATFSSNILFWLEGGYFDTPAELKPLLHTWSLAVEEQYYIIFPLLLSGLWFLDKKKIIIVLCILFIASLVFAHWSAYNKPNMSFFLLLSRIWEILMGSFCAFYLSYRPYPKNKILNEVVSILGLLLIGYSIIKFNHNTPTPSLFMLIPTMGVVLFILFSKKSKISKKLFSYKPLVKIGLISYSAYLWHYPLFAFSKYKFLEVSNNFYFICFLIILTFALAYMTWRLIEKPFRKKDTIYQKKILIISFLIALLILSIGFLGHKTKGFKQLMFIYKYETNLVERLKLVDASVNYDMDDFVYNKNCKIFTDNPKNLSQKQLNECSKKFGKALVIIGDSHAINVYNIFSKSKNINFIIGLAKGGCRLHSDRPTCQYESFKKFLKKNSNLIKKIIYHQSGSYLIIDKFGKVDSQNAFESNFQGFKTQDIKKIIKYLHALKNQFLIEVIWLGPFIEYRHIPTEHYGFKGNDSINKKSIEIFDKLEIQINKILDQQNFTSYVGFKKLFDFPKKSVIDNCFVFHDVDHFSLCGEDVLSKSKLLKNFMSK